MKTCFAGLTAGLALAVAQAATINNPWSGVAGDKGNMVGFAFQANAGNYPTSIEPSGSLTPTFSLDRLTLIRPNDTTTPSFGTGARQVTDANSPVFVDVYAGMPGVGSFAGYLGSSSSSVTWNGTAADQPFSWDFSGITLQTGVKYWFVFSEDNLDGEVSNFRAKLNTSGLDTAAGPGQGYLVSDAVQAITQANAAKDWAFAYTVGFTAVPEPSTLALAALGAGLLWARRWGRKA